MPDIATQRGDAQLGEEETVEGKLSAQMSVLANKTSPDDSLIVACTRVSDLSWQATAQNLELFTAQGGSSALVRLLRSSSEEVVDAAAAALASLSCPSSRKPRASREVHVGGHSILLSEQDFSTSGTGHTVWTSALVLGVWMAAAEQLPLWEKNPRVLELGSGLGVNGILAAKLGAKITLSDYFPPLIENLERQVVANGVAEKCRVVHLNWAAEAGIEAPTSTRAPDFSNLLGNLSASEVERCALLETNESFPIIIGADVCYEPSHPELLSATITRRLAPGGTAYIMSAVRFPELHARLLTNLAAAGNAVAVKDVSSEEGPLAVSFIEEGSTQHSSRYQGGLVLITVTAPVQGV